MATFFRSVVGQSSRGQVSAACGSTLSLFGSTRSSAEDLLVVRGTSSFVACNSSKTSAFYSTADTIRFGTRAVSTRAIVACKPRKSNLKTADVSSKRRRFRSSTRPSSLLSFVSSVVTTGVGTVSTAFSLSKRPVVTMASGDYSNKVKKTDDEWREVLTDKEYKVLRQAGTEPARTGEYDKHYPKTGYYKCRGCGLPLYSFSAKFNSGCGWPAYDSCYHSKELGAHCNFKEDFSHGMKRTEILCKRCDGHLGHVFYGELSAQSERHCVNSVSVKYVDGQEPADVQSGPLKANISSNM